MLGVFLRIDLWFSHGFVLEEFGLSVNIIAVVASHFGLFVLTF